MTDQNITVSDLRSWQEEDRKISMLTAYDYTSAKLVDEAGIDVILVGDSLGMVMLGQENTLSVTLDDMIHHTEAVVAGTENAFVVADMPFLSFQVSREEAVRNAGRIIKETGAQAVKLEGGTPVLSQVEGIVEAGIPVMGHLGLTPQSVNQMGGYKVQGKEDEKASRILSDAKKLEDAGACSLVLECVPGDLAEEVTRQTSIPTIGIGAGPNCNGQVLVFHDVLGLQTEVQPKFVRQYAQLKEQIVSSLKEFKRDVRDESFPDEEESF